MEIINQVIEILKVAGMPLVLLKSISVWLCRLELLKGGNIMENKIEALIRKLIRLGFMIKELLTSEEFADETSSWVGYRAVVLGKLIVAAEPVVGRGGSVAGVISEARLSFISVL